MTGLGAASSTVYTGRAIVHGYFMISTASTAQMVLKDGATIVLGSYQLGVGPSLWLNGLDIEIANSIVVTNNGGGSTVNAFVCWRPLEPII